MRMTRQKMGIALTVVGLAGAAGLSAQEGRPTAEPRRWRQHDIRRPKPPVAEPGEAIAPSKAPGDAIVLFDGSNLDAWKAPSGGPAGWRVKEGYMETAPGAGAVETKAAFGDIQLHVEWSAPNPPAGVGQDRGNSGIFLMGQFEVQVLDSYQADTYADGQAGAIYGQYPPHYNASRPPGEWQTYDIAFRRPRFDGSGRLLEPARITVFHNGVLVQNNEIPFGPTSWLKWLPYADRGGRGPISLQDHDHPVRYRNIWLRELPERAEPSAQDLALPPTIALAPEVLDRFAGAYLASTKPNAPTAKVSREGDHLVIVFPFRPQALALLPISETEFVMPYTDGRFTFRKDGQGKVTGALFRIGDGRREMRRVGD